MWTVLMAAVWAATPEVSADDAGGVRGTMVVAAPAPEVLALVRDPARFHALSPDGSTLVATPSGACFDITYGLENPIANVAYTARGCPTDTGFQIKLVQSEQFRSMTSTWTVREGPAGTEVTYVYQADVALPVPGFLVRRSTVNAITKAMTRLAAHVEG